MPSVTNWQSNFPFPQVSGTTHTCMHTHARAHTHKLMHIHAQRDCTKLAKAIHAWVEKCSSIFLLFATVRPVISAAEADVVGVEQQPADLRVIVYNEGDPAVLPTNIKWYKVGQPNELTNNSNMFISADRSVLHFNSVQFSDEDLYNVTYENPAGMVYALIRLLHEGMHLSF